jgi:hypothetical protein
MDYSVAEGKTKSRLGPRRFRPRAGPEDAVHNLNGGLDEREARHVVPEEERQGGELLAQGYCECPMVGIDVAEQPPGRDHGIVPEELAIVARVHRAEFGMEGGEDG